jgi:hypothetical protein
VQEICQKKKNNKTVCNTVWLPHATKMQHVENISSDLVNQMRNKASKTI